MRLGAHGRAVLLVSITLLFSAWAPLRNTVSLSACVSPQRTRFCVSDKSPLPGPGRIPLPATLPLLMRLSWSLKVFWFCVVSDATNLFLCMSTFSNRPCHSAFSQGFVISGHEVPAATWFWRFLGWSHKEFWSANGCQIGPKFGLVPCLSQLLNVDCVLLTVLPSAGKTGFSWQVCQITSKRPVCTCLMPQPLPPDLIFKETLMGPCCALAVLGQLLGGLKPC